MPSLSLDESRFRPARDPMFTETMQIGIVVRDLDVTLRTYVDEYGLGPLEVFELSSGSGSCAWRRRHPDSK